MTAENSFLNTHAVNNAEVYATALISCVAQWTEKDVVDLEAEQGEDRKMNKNIKWLELQGALGDGK